MYRQLGKPIFDFTMACMLLVITSPIMLFLYLLASIDTQSNGIFKQKRVGKGGRFFTIYKFKSIQDKNQTISSIGQFFRKSKLDELPQLFNIILGQMSFVGPRPDIAGYYDQLVGNDRKVLLLKPGITSEASIKYRNEEHHLSLQENPLEYNDTVIFPEKVKMNLDYLERLSFYNDLKIIWKTAALFLKK